MILHKILFHLNPGKLWVIRMYKGLKKKFINFYLRKAKMFGRKMENQKLYAHLPKIVKLQFFHKKNFWNPTAAIIRKLVAIQSTILGDSGVRPHFTGMKCEATRQWSFRLRPLNKSIHAVITYSSNCNKLNSNFIIYL